MGSRTTDSRGTMAVVFNGCRSFSSWSPLLPVPFNAVAAVKLVKK